MFSNEEQKAEKNLFFVIFKWTYLARSTRSWWYQFITQNANFFSPLMNPWWWYIPCTFFCRYVLYLANHFHFKTISRRLTQATNLYPCWGTFWKRFCLKLLTTTMSVFTKWLVGLFVDAGRHENEHKMLKNYFKHFV